MNRDRFIFYADDVEIVPNKVVVTLKSFEGHKGIPGVQGGSLPRNASAIMVDTTNDDVMHDLFLEAKNLTGGIENI